MGILAPLPSAIVNILTDHVLFLFLKRSSSSYEVHHVRHGASSANLFARRICNHNLRNHRIRISCWKISLCVQPKCDR